jgi:transcription antitermination protein NusB
MISRRNIRVKVMQALYALDSAETEKPAAAAKPQADPVKLLKKQVDLSRQLFIYLVHFLTEVVRYAETDAHNKAAKHLPTTHDLNINTKIAGNSVVGKMLASPSYQQALKEDKPALIINKDLIRRFYLELVEKPRYQQYILQESRDGKTEREILEFVFSEILLPSELFTSHLEELFTNWDDDCDMMNLLMLNYIQKPGTYNFNEMISHDKWQFAKDLLLTVQQKKEITLSLIKPKLKNWDADRIAVLDMIMMQMGVCEFLFFDTIPPKVTINEYIDLAKEYSTPQSGQFVNGILDNIHKDLVTENKLHKVNFKKN